MIDSDRLLEGDYDHKNEAGRFARNRPVDDQTRISTQKAARPGDDPGRELHSGGFLLL
jgi:hypothetical protein